MNKNRVCRTCHRLFGNEKELEEHKRRKCDGKIECQFCSSRLVGSLFVAHRDECHEKMIKAVSDDSMSDGSRLSATTSNIDSHQENAINDNIVADTDTQRLSEDDESSASSSSESDENEYMSDEEDFDKSDTEDESSDSDSKQKKVYKSKQYAHFKNRVFNRLVDLYRDECSEENIDTNFKRGKKTTTEDILKAKSNEFFSTVLDFALSCQFESKKDVLDKHGIIAQGTWKETRQDYTPREIYAAVNTLSKGQTQHFDNQLRQKSIKRSLRSRAVPPGPHKRPKRC